MSPRQERSAPCRIFQDIVGCLRLRGQHGSVGEPEKTRGHSTAFLAQNRGVRHPLARAAGYLGLDLQAHRNNDCDLNHHQAERCPLIERQACHWRAPSFLPLRFPSSGGTEKGSRRSEGFSGNTLRSASGRRRRYRQKVKEHLPCVNCISYFSVA